MALALFPMKYPEYRLSMEAALPSSVQSWLGQQLELRGIDSHVYTRYIISLLQQDPEDLDGYDNEIDLFFTTKLDTKRWKAKKVEKRKPVFSEEEKKKKAAIECLTAVSDEKCGIEKLVEELCIRLKDTESQVSVSPFVNIQSSSSSYESSEESGPELQNPAQRYYAAFPDLHGNKSLASNSPSVTTKSSVWKINPLVKPCSGENQSENATAVTDVQPPLEKSTRSLKQAAARCNIKKKDGSFEKQRHSSKSSQTKPGKGKRDKDRPKRRFRKDERLQSWPPSTETSEFDNLGTDSFELEPFFIPDNFEECLHETKTPKRENEELCTKVESILKGMLLPTPCKTYKELEDVDEGEPKEQLERVKKHQSPISQISLSREDSVSPEHQEQDIWYTQPIDIIFQTQEENNVPTKPRLYKRTSHPDSLTESGKEDSASTSSSPVCNRIRNDSTASDDDDDIWAGSVLIPAWLTDELSIDHEEILPGTVAFSSSFKSSSPNEKLLSTSSDTKSVEKKNEEQEKFPSGLWSLCDDFHGNTDTGEKIWSGNDDVEEYLTPTPTQDLLLLSQQKSNENSQNLFWFTPSAPVSLIDVDYLSNLMSLNVESHCNSNGLVDRTPCLSSLWQSQILFDISLYNTEQSNPELECLETGNSMWQFDKEFLGYSLAKLWNVNMQKRQKGSVWGPDTDKDSHLWFGENAHMMNDASWYNCGIDDVVKQQCIQDFENTLIPEIFIEIFNEDNLDDDVFEESETRNIKPLYDRSFSMNNVPSLWSSDSDKEANPELSKSFELVPSETSAFEDVPRKLQHVLSEPNLARHRREKDSVQQSPQEHLYFSPKTHFRPITPAYAPELCAKSKQQQVCNDLFGGITSSKTPYQQYVTDPTSDDESFVPKFKVKNYNKYIQTGNGDGNKDVTTSPTEDPDLEEELSTPENLTLGMIENIVNDTDAMDDYLIRIYEDLDAANNDSAYETDYGISTVEAEQENGKNKSCSHRHDVGNSEQEKHAENYVDHGSLGEQFDYGITSLAATYPHFQDWPEMLYSYQNSLNTDELNKEHEEKQLAKSWHEPSYFDQEAWRRDTEYDDISYIMENARAMDSHDLWSCDHDAQQTYLLEKYKNIWSTGQENSETESKDGEICENDFLSVDKLFYEDQTQDSKKDDKNLNEHFFEMSDGRSEQFIDGRVNPVLERNIGAEQGLPQESFFSIKLVNKDKVRKQGVQEQGKQREAGNGNSYGTYDLAPMPDEALFSAELEKEWTSPEMQLLLSQHKHSRFQRKPCSFFLEGNCRRSDCKFAHDISNITCRFWEEGGCFKGPLCPFLHGYRSEPVKDDETSNQTSAATEAVTKEKFDLNGDEFPDLSISKACVSTKRAKSGRSQNSNSFTSKKDKLKRGSNSRRSSNKENHPDTKKD